MDLVFIKLLNMSISASWLVLAVIVLRFLLKKSPKWIHVALWALVAVRLLCPFSIESAMSLIPSGETIPETIIYAQTPAIDSGVEVIDQAVNASMAESLTPQAGASVNPVQVHLFVQENIWCLGMVFMLGWAIISYFRIKKKVSASIDLGNGIYICDYIATPFILGIVKPKIYLPSTMEPDSASHVLAHERSHIARKDHWWKPFGYLLLTVHWFNPVLWLAYILLCRDIELACDEKVIRNMEAGQKKAYSEALLKCSVNRRQIAACPLAFGEVGVKERVKTVLNYKKPAFWIVLIAILALIVTAVCFLTDPKTEEPKVTGESPYTWTSTVASLDIQKAWAYPYEGATYHNTIEGSKLDELLSLLNEVQENEIVARKPSGEQDPLWNYGGTSINLYCNDGMSVFIRYMDDTVIIGTETESGIWEVDGYWVMENENLTRWIEKIANGGSYMLSDENREEIRRLLRMEHVQFFDPREYDDLLFVGCAYDNGRGLGVACFEKVAYGYKLLRVLRDEDVKKCASGDQLYYCDYNQYRIFLILNQNITGMEWAGAYENTYAIDTHPGLVVEHFPQNLGSMYRFNYGGGSTTMYMDWDNQTHAQVPDYTAGVFASPDDPHSVCTNISLDQVDYIWTTELIDVDDGYHQALAAELNHDEMAQLLNILHKLPEDAFEPEEYSGADYRLLDIALHNYTGQTEVTPVLSLKLSNNEVYYQLAFNGIVNGRTWKIKSPELTRFIEGFFDEDKSQWHRFAPVPKIVGEVSCDFYGMKVYVPKLAAFDYVVTEEGIRFKPEKEDGYILVKYCPVPFDFNSTGKRIFNTIYGGVPGVLAYDGTEEIWSFMEMTVTNPVWYVPKPDADNMPSMNVRLINEDKASWVEEYSDQIGWIQMELRIHVIG